MSAPTPPDIAAAYRADREAFAVMVALADARWRAWLALGQEDMSRAWRQVHELLVKFRHTSGQTAAEVERLIARGREEGA